MDELPRHVAPGGAKRLIIGFACGLLAGGLVALVLPREDGPRRRTPSRDISDAATGRGPSTISEAGWNGGLGRAATGHTATGQG